MKTAKAKSTSSVLICSGCKFPVHKEVHNALGLQWHRNCFRCSECLSTIPQHYMPRDNVLYCNKDYLLKFGQHCQRCTKQITGPVMVAGEQKYHTECFVCTKCLKFIGYGDEYMLLERHNLYCNHCYKRTILPAISTPVSKLDHCHTIQHINLKPTPVGRRQFSVLIEKGSIASKLLNSVTSNAGQVDERKSFIAIENVDASSELKARGVKSGDKVLEVNDIVVTDDTLDKLSQIISNPQKVHTLTIERNKSGQPPAIETENRKDSENAGTTTPVKSPNGKIPAHRQTSLDLLGSCDYDQKFKRNHNSQGEEDVFDCNVVMPLNPSDDSRKTRKKERANSLPRSNSVDNSVLKCNSPLHRSQSMKSSDAEAGKAFRPSELIVGEVIGKGFFGQVSKVVHRGTGKVMVLKELIRWDGDAQKQFIKEVTLLKTLDHPNVLKFIGILYKNKVLSLIAEYVAGGTLRGILKDQTRELSWSQRVKFAKDIALGMDYLHSMNVIHRDLKSKNCLVRNDEGMTIVVADFGLAGMMSIEQETKQTNSQDQNNNAHRTTNSNHLSSRPPAPTKRTTVVGSPYWMAPEMIKGKGYDERVDTFSFGIIVCEVISRVKADPDFLPRTKSFGLDEQAFEGKFCQKCPIPFFQLACLCCDLEPRKRPSFSSLGPWLEALLAHLEIGIPLPAEVQFSLLPKTLKTSLTNEAKEANLAR